MIKNIERLIGEHSFFRGLPEGDLALIAGCGVNKVFQDGDPIARENQDADQFYVIRSGRIAITTHVPSKGELTLQTLEEGEVLGWSWLFPPYKWCFDATAVKETRVVSLDGQCLRGKCEADPAMGYRLMKRFASIMSDRLQATRLQLLDVYGRAEG